MIKNILVATDGSAPARAAWRHALDIARAYQTALRLITVVDARVPAGVLSEGGDSTFAPTAEVESDEYLQQVLEELRASTLAGGVEVEAEIAHGQPADAIASYDRWADLFAIGHRGDLPPWDRFLMGSVAEKVVHHVSRPVFIAPGPYAPLRTILAAYDGSRPGRRALQWAANLAATMNLSLVVTHVTATREIGWSVLQQAKAELAAHPLRQVSLVLRQGEIGEAILDTASERVADLVVMGARGYSPLDGTQLGSATEGVLARFELPLVITR